MFFNQNFAFIRKKKGLTNPAFGEIIGATEGQCKSYERGTEPTLQTLCNVADYAGLTLDALVRIELTDENYSTLHQPQLTGHMATDLQKQIDELSTRVKALERKTKTRVAR